MTDLASAIDAGYRGGRIALSPRNKRHFRQRLIDWFKPQSTPHPWRATRRGRRDPYRVWVSEIMLQQTTIGAVTPKYRNFMANLPTIESLASATELELRPLVQGLGYYRRFNLLHKAAKLLVTEAKAAGKPVRWPTTYDGWRELPGVGDYTAAAVSSLAFAEQKVALDGNGERILQRLLASTEPLTAAGKKRLKPFADELLGQSPAGLFNEALMELGQKICIRKIPRCQICPITRYCQAHARGEQNAIPVAAPKMAMVTVPLTMVVPISNDQLGLRQRGAKAKFLKGQLGFATCIGHAAGLEQECGGIVLDGHSSAKDSGLAEDIQAAKALRQLLADSESAGEFSHAITHHRLKVAVKVTSIADPANLSAAGFRFIPITEVIPQLAASLDIKTAKKILAHIAYKDHHERN